MLMVSFLAFGLSRCSPGDPVDNFLPIDDSQRASFDSYADYQRRYAEFAAELNVDGPYFYFSITPASHPDTLHRVLDRNRKALLNRLLDASGNWERCQDYYRQLLTTEAQLLELRSKHRNDQTLQASATLSQLFSIDAPSDIPPILNKLERQVQADALLEAAISPAISDLQERYRAYTTDRKAWLNYLPGLHWYGLNNQYHEWMRDFIQGKFGKSYRDGREVSEVILRAMRWTLLLNGLAILLAYGLSIPIGVYSAAYKDSWMDRWSGWLLFGLYSLPNFWAAMLLTIYLTTPEYGLDLFPTMGMGELPTGASWWDVLKIRLWHLTLPVWCLAYPALAFISRQMRAAMLTELDKDYIRTARAKGLSEQRVIWGHAFRNASFPLITLLASVLPAALAGSVIIEVIFNIPGIGRLTLDSINTQDWPIVFALLFLTALFTILGILISDLGYALADPRVRLQSPSK